MEKSSSDVFQGKESGFKKLSNQTPASKIQVKIDSASSSKNGLNVSCIKPNQRKSVVTAEDLAEMFGPYTTDQELAKYLQIDVRTLRKRPERYEGHETYSGKWIFFLNRLENIFRTSGPVSSHTAPITKNRCKNASKGKISQIKNHLSNRTKKIFRHRGEKADIHGLFDQQK